MGIHGYLYELIVAGCRLTCAKFFGLYLTSHRFVNLGPSWLVHQVPTAGRVEAGRMFPKPRIVIIEPDHSSRNCNWGLKQ